MLYSPHAAKSRYDILLWRVSFNIWNERRRCTAGIYAKYFLPISQAKGQGGIRRSTDVEHTKGDYLLLWTCLWKWSILPTLFLWNVILILLLCGTGIYYTLRLKFVQIREFKQGLKQVFGGIGKKHEKKEGEMTSFQSVATAIAAQVGTGNLTGAATAWSAADPGAIFWIVDVRFLWHGNHLCRSYSCNRIIKQYSTEK